MADTAQAGVEVRAGTDRVPSTHAEPSIVSDMARSEFMSR